MQSQCSKRGESKPIREKVKTYAGQKGASLEKGRVVSGREKEKVASVSSMRKRKTSGAE